MTLVLVGIGVVAVLYIFGDSGRASRTVPSVFTSGRLIGKSKAEVIGLLDRPQDGDLKTDEFYYRIGEGDGYMPGNTWAVIRFENGRVVSVSEKAD